MKTTVKTFLLTLTLAACLAPAAGANIGVGTSLPGARLQVAGGDAYVSTVGNGLILRSPNGNCFRMTVSNAGTLGSAAVACP